MEAVEGHVDYFHEANLQMRQKNANFVNEAKFSLRMARILLRPLPWKNVILGEAKNPGTILDSYLNGHID
jgi:hypothetical protein